MDFNSQEELYNHVRPALRSKIKEFRRSNCDYIKEEDIWNYLIETNWKQAKDLTIAEVVNDILKCKYNDIDNYIKNKFKQSERKIYFNETIS